MTGSNHNMSKVPTMVFFLIRFDPKLISKLSNYWQNFIDCLSLNTACVHIFNDSMTSFLVIANNKLTVLLSNRDLYFVAIMIWMLHPHNWMNWYMRKMGNFLHHILHLVLFHIKLKLIAHML